MDKIAYTLLFIAGLAVYFLTPPDAWFAWLMAGVCWGISGYKLIAT